MGLDMYLYADKYLSGHSFNGPDARKRLERAIKAAGLPADQLASQAPSATLQMTVAYWRKANAIHSWFVRNAQNGVDECQRAHVSREQLAALRDQCVKAMQTQDPGELLPTGGFFFGSVAADEWYWKDLETTAARINDLLASNDLTACEFYYQSSW